MVESLAAAKMSPSPKAMTVSNPLRSKGRVISIERYTSDFRMEVANMLMGRMMQHMSCMLRKMQCTDMMQ